MDLLPAQFTVIRFFGVWVEEENSNLFIRVFSLFYGYMFAVSLYYLTLFEIVDGIMCRNDVDAILQTLFFRVSLVGTCCKVLNFYIHQKQILVLLDRFRSIACRSQTPVEQRILDKYKQTATWYAIIYMAMAQFTTCGLLILPLFGLQNGRRPLPFKLYLLYSVSDVWVYVVTYVHQVITLLYTTSMNIVLDSIVYGLLLHTCAQLDVLNHRLLHIFDNLETDDNNEKKRQRMILFENCIRHHLLIFDIVKRIQKIFGWIITAMFLYTLITLCTLIFRMSQVSVMSVEFLSVVMFFVSMLFEVYCYCWFGNELEIKNRNIGDAVYFSNWQFASTGERKNLLIIMTNSEKSLNLSCHGIFALTLDTFTWMVKTSFSAFNVLQQMED